MSILASIQKGVGAAFSAVGDYKEPLTFVSIREGAYDPATGTTSTSAQQTLQIEVITLEKKASRVAAYAMDDDEVMVLAESEGFNFDPKSFDRVTYRDRQWLVSGYYESAQSMFKMKLKPAAG